MTQADTRELRDAIEKVLVKNYLPNKLAGKKLYGEYVDVVLDLLDVFAHHQKQAESKYFDSVLRARAKSDPNLTVKEWADRHFAKHQYRGASMRDEL